VAVRSGVVVGVPERVRQGSSGVRAQKRAVASAYQRQREVVVCLEGSQRNSASGTQYAPGCSWCVARAARRQQRP